MAYYILNAFSLNMIPTSAMEAGISVIRVGRDNARLFVESTRAISGVGHADTAAVFSSLLGVPIAANRCNVILSEGDEALVGQYVGPRLPEGATALPEGARIDWFILYLQKI